MRKKRIFVSCGQETPDEICFGNDILETITRHEMDGFFANEVHSASDLNSEVFRAIQSCDGFFAVLHKRGEVNYSKYTPVQRSSVWIQQEIAIICYGNFLQERPVPIRVYSEKGILLEGVMKTAIVNPIDFETKEAVLKGLSKWLTGPEFREHPVLARREALFRNRIEPLGPEDWLLLELIAAHSAGPGDETSAGVVLEDYRKIQGQVELSGIFPFDAFNLLHASGLVVQNQRHGTVSISKIWWDLVLDELRNQGRKI